MTPSSVIIFATFILLAYAQTHELRDVTCTNGQQMCDDYSMGPTCYDPSIYTCPTGSKGSVLCGNQEHGPDGACGSVCYDMTDYVCCNDKLYNAHDNSAPCTATQAPTSPDAIMCGGEKCLALYQCCNDTKMGPSCFDPNGASCPVGSSGPILCGFQEHGADGACGTTCYDMVDYQCCNDKVYGINDQTPCSAATSAPTIAATTAPTAAATKAPTKAPTKKPTKAPTKAPTKKPTKAPTLAPTKAPTAAPTSPAALMCGGQQCLALYECCNDVNLGPSCYDPNGASCPVGSSGPILCGFQEHGADGACGTTCYDMVDYQCCNDKVYGINEQTPCSSAATTQKPATLAPTVPATLAPTSPPVSANCGHAPCQAGYQCCNDMNLGPTCFNPSTYSCPVGSQGPILCGFQEHGADGTCGSVCYDMVDYKCCNDELYGSDDASAPC